MSSTVNADATTANGAIDSASPPPSGPALPPPPSYDDMRGGSSSLLTKGEMAFVSVLSLVVCVSIFVACYVVYRRRRPKPSSSPPPDVSIERAIESGMTSTTKTMEGEATGGRGASRMPSSELAGRVVDSPPRHSSSRSSSRTRRPSNAASVGGGISRRGSEDLLRDVSGHHIEGRSNPKRRLTTGSIGSNVVSTKYKLAAIDHMNQMSVAGR
jgi:hypothetical protein